MKENLEIEVKSILAELGVENPKVNFESPIHMELGDLSTNLGMVYAKELSKKPFDLAEEIKNKLEEKKVKYLSKIEVIKPGFINFFFDKEYFGGVVQNILSEKNYGKNKDLKGKKIIIEHTQPNPFKAFHIGHLMNNTIGESASRILKESSAEVQTATYHGDVGLHIAKAVWAIKTGKALSEAQNAYAIGSRSYEDSEKDGQTKNEIEAINVKIYLKNDKEINEIYEKGLRESLNKFEILYKKLGNTFDYHFFESESGEIGKSLVLENIGSIFEKGDEGAIIFKGENFLPKTHTRVFLNKDGLPTYEAKELGLAQIKSDFFDFDKSITVTASEQDSFFKVVEVAIGEVFPELKGKLTHLSHGMMRLPEGKMSSRTGNIISAESLISQVQDRLVEKMTIDGKKPNDMSGPEIVDIAEMIAIGAIKYSILRQAIGGDIIFDFDKSISFEGDSGPYLQYSAVRANSLLKKAEGEVKISNKLPDEWKTTNLERLLERFPSVVSRAGSEYAPHYVATYLIDLAGEFNSFYATHKIIDKEDTTSLYRLALTKSFAQVMTTGLNLLGIKVPEKM